MQFIMESCNEKESSQNIDSLPKKQEEHFIITSSNWEIDNNKSFDDCVSTMSLLQAPDRTNLEDVVSLDTCVALKPDPSGELCRLEFKVTNKQKVARIAVVSEALVLEFFKQSGEYATTSFAEFVDEFQDHAVYFAEAKIQPPSSDASIKFTRTKNKGTTMWIYGIKLILTESTSESSKSMFDLEVINSYINSTSELKPEKAEMARRFLGSFTAVNENNGDGMNAYLQKIAMGLHSHKFLENDKNNEVRQLKSVYKKEECNGDSILPQDSFNLKSYIDDKFANLEKRLMEKIDLIDQKTNQKLDAILKHYK